MEDHLYVVIWRTSSGPWKAEPHGAFTERRLAENLIECRKAAGETWTFAIVEGPITNPAQMEEAEKALGEF